MVFRILKRKRVGILLISGLKISVSFVHSSIASATTLVPFILISDVSLKTFFMALTSAKSPASVDVA